MSEPVIAVTIVMEETSQWEMCGVVFQDGSGNGGQVADYKKAHKCDGELYIK